MPLINHRIEALRQRQPEPLGKTCRFLEAIFVPYRDELGQNADMHICRIIFLLLLIPLPPLMAAELEPILDSAERHIRIQTQDRQVKLASPWARSTHPASRLAKQPKPTHPPARD